jgi:uncharacterized protein (TIGR03067 family)
MDGRTMTGTEIEGAKIVIKGARFTSVAMGATYKGTMIVQPRTKPRSFDLVFTAGPERGNRNLGIYKLDDDRWTICLATRGATRPARFATRAGSGIALEVLERGTGARRPVKAPARPEPAVSSAAATELEGEWTMVSGVLNGKPLTPDMVKWCRRITRGDVTSVVAGPQTMVKARFVLDRSTNPRAIEYTNLEGASAGKTQAGIFSLSGEDLAICMSAPGKPRPTDFGSKPGDGRSYTTWRRPA